MKLLVISVKENTNCRNVNIKKLQKALKNQGLRIK